MSKRKAKPAEPAHSGQLILSVDDDPDIRDLVSAILGERGYTVIQAGDAFEALDLVRTERPDLIMLDAMMPEVDGYGFCESLQETGLAEATPIIFMSALSEEADRTRAFQCGAVDYLVKPISREELAEKVERHLDTARAWSDIGEEAAAVPERDSADDFASFRRRLTRMVGAGEEHLAAVAAMRPDDIYASARDIGMSPQELAIAVAEHLGLEYLPILDATAVVADALPVAFCRKNLIVPVTRNDRPCTSWPTRFTGCARPVLKRARKRGVREANAPPDLDQRAVHYGGIESRAEEPAASEQVELTSAEDVWTRRQRRGHGVPPIVFIANSLILIGGARTHANIHIEPKEASCHIRFRIDGDMRDMRP